jgi:tRNA(Arg) A34 adenosine deaminase TadA
MLMDATDHRLLREAFALARRARDRGDQPFGAVLAGPDRAVLLEATNTVATAGDVIGHAEVNLVREACRRFDRAFLARCTLYASAEPCAMCAGAIFWVGVGRLVFGLSTARLNDLTGKGSRGCDVRLTIPCRGVFAGGRPAVEVIGPLFQAEAEQAHRDYWRAPLLGRSSGGSPADHGRVGASAASLSGVVAVRTRPESQRSCFAVEPNPGASGADRGHD